MPIGKGNPSARRLGRRLANNVIGRNIVRRLYRRRTPEFLRHSCASILIKHKANPKQVQRYLGHATISITMDTYVGLFPDDLDELADSLEALRSESFAETPIPTLNA